MKKVFISYAHRDESYKDELKTHLKSLERRAKIKIWDDRAIDAGDEWHDEIMNALEDADIILMLISNYFIDSDFIWDKELKRALERHEAKTARVIPIIIRPCDWYDLPFGKLQAVPRNGEAISTWDNPDEAYLFIAQQINRLLTP
ncbi:MAG TPA: toll/interleukin-1 receptor domain-containing protein [Phaeodactylibacter sp.]|nr:toll/interleukin-1 receptor domain-containing protein [Phaeodactylibacter sp.]